MVDLILFSFFAGTFVAGFWVGKTFGTFKAAGARAVGTVRGWFA